MYAAQVSVEESKGPLRPPTLRVDQAEELSVDEMERLLVCRFRAFSERGLNWQEALRMAVTPEAFA